MSKVLPAHPSLDPLKKQAKALLEAIRNQIAEAIALFAAHHPLPKQDASRFILHDAQLVIARDYGFASWAKLKEEIERRTSTFDQRVDQFIIDARDNLGKARRALDAEPALANANWWTQLVTGNVAAIADALQRDAALASKPGGPAADGKTWRPLHYVCQSRLQTETDEARARFTRCAGILLDAGADPNAAVDKHKLQSPLGGSAKLNNLSLLRLLLERGAAASDFGAICWAGKNYHLEALEALHKAGASLGTYQTRYGTTTPLYHLLDINPHAWGAANVSKGIRWLLDHGCDATSPSDVYCTVGEEAETALLLAIPTKDTEIIRALLDAGADVNWKTRNGVTPLTRARCSGRKDVVALLKEYGATETTLTPRERFLEAVFSGDKPGVSAILAENPGLIEVVKGDFVPPLHAAVIRENLTALRLVLDAGFDVAFQGRMKTTALHAAAWRGGADYVDALIARGASANLVDVDGHDPLGCAAQGSTVFRNPQGDYPRIARTLLAAGAKPKAEYTEDCTPEVAEIIQAALET